MTGFLLDTNVVSEPNRPRPNPAVTAWLSQVDERRTFLSAMTLAETRKGIAKLGSDSRAARLEILLTGLRHRFQGRILPLDEDVLDRWGRLTGVAEAGGVRLPVIDALFAATALHHNLVLVTRNVRDVAGSGVALFNPWAWIPQMSWRYASAVHRFAQHGQSLTLDQAAGSWRTRWVKGRIRRFASVSGAFGPVDPIHLGNPGWEDHY